MNTKLLVIGTVAGALTLFAWETVSNTAIPWHAPTMRSFPDSNAAVQAIRALAPENGMYVDVRGVVAAISFLPDMSSRERLVGLMIGRQLALDFIIAFALLFTMLRLPRVSTRQYAAVFGVGALAMGLSAFGSDWNWFGFGVGWTVVNILDRVIGYALMGFALGACVNKWSGRATTDEWSGVRAGGSLPGSRTSSPGAKR